MKQSKSRLTILAVVFMAISLLGTVGWFVDYIYLKHGEGQWAKIYSYIGGWMSGWTYMMSVYLWEKRKTALTSNELGPSNAR